MRISDWSSDVCSSDLNRVVVEHLAASTPWVGRAQIDGVAILHPDAIELRPVHTQGFAVASIDGVFGYGKLSDLHLQWQKIAWPPDTANAEIGRASCRERVWQYV